MEETEKRIEDLEIKISYMENTIGELNDVVTSYEKRLEKLEAKTKLIVSKLEELNEKEDPMPGNVKPPHY